VPINSNSSYKIHYNQPSRSNISSFLAISITDAVLAFSSSLARQKLVFLDEKENELARVLLFLDGLEAPEEFIEEVTDVISQLLD
jgi:hypothetical protein